MNESVTVSQAFAWILWLRTKTLFIRKRLVNLSYMNTICVPTNGEQKSELHPKEDHNQKTANLNY